MTTFHPRMKMGRTGGYFQVVGFLSLWPPVFSILDVTDIYDFCDHKEHSKNFSMVTVITH